MRKIAKFIGSGDSGFNSWKRKNVFFIFTGDKSIVTWCWQRVMEKKLKKEGYDGIVANYGSTKAFEIIPFSKSQVKIIDKHFLK